MEDRQSKTQDSGRHQEDTKDSIKESSSSVPSLTPLTCTSSRPDFTQTISPCPVIGGSTNPPEGGNNAKWTTVANGQPPSAVSQRYMPREVPPRFRNQQEPKVLLKRGQPPLSCMLLGGGQGGDVTPSTNASTSDPSDATVSLHSSSDASATPTYANYSWGLGPEGQSSAQGMDNIDSSDTEKWPSLSKSGRLESSWSSDQRASSPICEYSEASAVVGASSRSEIKESIKGADQSFNSKVPSSAGDQEGSRGLNPNYSPPSWSGPVQDDPDGGLLTNTASEESPPTPLSPAGALSQTLSNNKECIMGDWAELKAGPNVVNSKDDGVNLDAWDTGEEQVKRGSDTAGDNRTVGDESSVGTTGISQGEMGVTNEQASTGWTSDSVGTSREDSSVFATSSVTSRDDNQKGVNVWDGLEKESARGESSRDGMHIQSPLTSQTSNPEEALQTMINRTNLDPKVLCNTGWGKTQIKQSVAWNVENVVCNVEEDTSRHKEGWKGTGDAPFSSSKKQEGMEVSHDQRWGGEGQKWDERTVVKRDGWGMHGEVGTGHKGGGWGEAQDNDSTCRREGAEWDQGSRSEWRQTTPLPEAGGWKETRSSDSNNQGEGLWGSSEKEGHQSGGWGGVNVKQHQGWGEKHLPSQIPNKQTALKTQNQPQQQSQTQQQMPGHPKALQDRGQPGGPEGQSKGSGWTCGPIPEISSVVEPSGWEEPSPQSISRNMEIDDGTSAWGDPSRYKNKNVNLWDKKSSQTQQQSCQSSVTQSSGRQTGAPPKNPVSATWGHGGSGSPDQSVDNGAAAWGKSVDAPASWGDSEEPGKAGVWGISHSRPTKSGSKSMQEGWADESSPASRHSSWEEEDGGTGVWGSRGSQSSMSTYNSGSWNQNHGGRRHSTRSPVKGNSGDSWATPMTRQFSNMGIMDEDSSMSQERQDKRGMNDGDMRRGGRAGGAFRSQNSKEITPGDSGPYLDKTGGHAMFGSGGIAQQRGVHQAGVHPLNRSPVMRAQVPQFLPPQVAGPMLKPMAPPSGGMFPPQLSPQHIAMLGGVHPHMQQFQLACQLLLQQQQQQQQFLNQRKFPAPPRPQHDQQQLARIMAILQQQQGLGGGKLPSSPMGGPISKHPDTPPLHHLNKQPDVSLHAAMGGPEMHNKPSTAFTGFAGASDLDSLIGSSGGLKDGGSVQSRFKWMMDGSSLTPSPPEPTLHNGPVKLSGGSSYSQYDVLGGSWHRSSGVKVDTSPVNPTWPPEFQPGVPWKGVPSPEPDPYMTPAGLLGTSVLTDTEHHLLQDNTGSNSLNTRLPSPGAWPYSTSDPTHTVHASAKYSELKSSWPPEPIGHGKSWRTNRNSSHLPRPPPGLTSQKQAWSGEGPRMPRVWGGGANTQELPFKPEWSDGGAGKSWLLLRNLTPQIDGSTLKTICLQHGPLLTFHLGLTQGSALIRYCSPHEAAKAQSALHMCVLGNTTILAEFMSDDEVMRYFTHSQTTGVTGSPDGSSGSDPTSREGGGSDEGAAVRMASAGWQGLDVSGGSGPEGPGLALLSQWSNSTEEGAGKGFWGGVAPGYHGSNSSSLWATSQLEDGPAGLLPGNLLGGGTDSL
ncbi:trinucleotide repeat-containing gene 6B protein [Misgurnus anguillicaudatus]|uniref:trinucleotide repeat-containing gene 6B protein n=1 Tax=Misgurnus anguillicaudatus TaxID=75329 RepID=UPI003CCF44DE